MTKVLIAYGTSDGQAGKIAEHIASVLREHGCEAYPVDLKRETPDPRAYDAVIVGASVRQGKHQTYVGEFVRETRPALNDVPNAFFSVSLAAADGSEAGLQEAQGYVEEFLRVTLWRPLMTRPFAGALLYTHYNFLLRWVMKRIARSKGSKDLDTSRDYEYTDWTAVRQFAEEFARTLVPEDEKLVVW
jgi:menaquinone-dependent protoporphyrinogen oxidase